MQSKSMDSQISQCNSILEGKVLYRTLKGSKALRIWNP